MKWTKRTEEQRQTHKVFEELKDMMRWDRFANPTNYLHHITLKVCAFFFFNVLMKP